MVYAGVRNRDGLKVAIKHVAKLKIKEWENVSKFNILFFIFQRQKIGTWMHRKYSFVYLLLFLLENYVEKVAKYFCFVELVLKILNCFLRSFVERLLCCLNE